ncbi:MAG: hypothetical protein RL386_2123 [Bacteroidota bacterium]|jgi:predicted MPP superfamily phosphohydrolase
MRIFVFLAFILLIDLYCYQAWKLFNQGWKPAIQLASNIFFWSIPVIAIVSFAAGRLEDSIPLNRHVVTYFRTLLFIAYLSKFLVLPFLAIDDLRRMFQWAGGLFQNSSAFNPQRSRFLTQFGLFMGSIPFFSMTYGMLRNPYRYRLFQTTIVPRDLPKALDGLRIVQISDIHSGSFTFKEPVKAAIDLINAQQPDLVFFTGDLVNSRSEEMLPFMDVFDKIKAKYGVFSILGNHDYGDYSDWESEDAKNANFQQLKDIHRGLGWELLLNEHRIVEVNGAKIAVIGVENHSAHLRFPKRGDLAGASQGTEGTDLKLLLSHDPSHWDLEVNKAFKDIAVTFSGHTHGFQFGVEIPGFFKWSPIKFLYKQWAGLYEKDRQFLYVNRGLGFLGYPGRVGILPEVALLELRSPEIM